MERPVETSPRLLARTAGVFYLLTIVTGVFAEVFVRGAVVVRGDAAATAANILAREPLYRLGLAADLVMLVCYVAVTALFYRLFVPAGRDLSLVAAFFSLIGIAVLAANSLNHLAPLVLLKNASGLGSLDPQALALLFLRLHPRGYAIAGVFFGVYCILIGWLVFRAGFLPRILGVLMAIGGASYVIDSFAGFLAPALAARLPDIMLLGGLGELALGLWLTVKGVRE